MNNWDKVEKRRDRNYDHEIFMECVKFACFLLASCVYFYYIFWS